MAGDVHQLCGEIVETFFDPGKGPPIAKNDFNRGIPGRNGSIGVRQFFTQKINGPLTADSSERRTDTAALICGRMAITAMAFALENQKAVLYVSGNRTGVDASR